jgi:hypothetical protein
MNCALRPCYRQRGPYRRASEASAGICLVGAQSTGVFLDGTMPPLSVAPFDCYVFAVLLRRRRRSVLAHQ